VQQPVGRSLGEGGVFDILAENSRALFFTASEEVPASAMVMLRLAFRSLRTIEIV
jgi:hypothetical protein